MRELPSGAVIADSWGGSPPIEKKTSGSPQMNGLEERYAVWLESQRRAEQLLEWRFGAVRLHLGGGTWYKPDFFLILPDNTIAIHETKGHWREAARVRIKVAASLYPFFTFVAVKAGQRRGFWDRERIQP